MLSRRQRGFCRRTESASRCASLERMPRAKPPLVPRLGWDFQPELGDILRKKDALVPGGHVHGDGSGDGVDSDTTWDELVFNEEVRRDERSRIVKGAGRVVETWHCGNLTWALQRGGDDCPDKDEVKSSFLKEQYARAIASEGKMAQNCRVIAVCLDITVKTMLRRRQGPAGEENRKRLPMHDEQAGCKQNQEAIGSRGCELLPLYSAAGCEVHVVENDLDGEDAMAATVDWICELCLAPDFSPSPYRLTFTCSPLAELVKQAHAAGLCDTTGRRTAVASGKN